jgi:ferritin-like metal-binding protein YciE
MPSMPMKTPQDLFVHELSDIHSAEQIIVKMLGEAQGLVQNPQLKQGLQQHQQQSEQHARNIEQILQQIGAKPHPVECKAVQGLFDELKEAQKAKPSPEVLEGIVAGGAAKTEHYEIAAYTGLLEKARAMGQTQAVQLLQQTLAQEQTMLRQVEQIGQQLTQQMAATAGASSTGQQPSAGAM